MIHQELQRLQNLQRVIEHRMTQTAAAHALGLSKLKRLMARFRQQGAAGLVSRKRGRRKQPAVAVSLHRTCFRPCTRALLGLRAHVGA